MADTPRQQAVIAAKAEIYRWRFYCVMVALAGLVAALVWHLVTLQVLPDKERGYEFLQGQGFARTLRTETTPASRGVITDRYGEPLAISTPVVSVWINPQKFFEDESTIDLSVKKLSDALQIKQSQLKQKLERYQRKEFMYLQRQMSPVDAEVVLSLGIPGVHGTNEYKRFYPAGEVTAHLVGFTNIDDKGQEGIELAYDQWLTGTTGKKQVLRDLSGRTIKDVAELESAAPGNELALSIDLRLQYLAYKELKAAVQAHQASSGSVVMLDVETGEVLAMANQPSFNPNDRRLLKTAALRNRAVTDQFEPGSTMKPLTIMAALETGNFTPKTIINTHPGYLRVGKKTLLDPVNYGEMDLAKIIQKSSQVGLTKVSLELDPLDIREMYFRLGLGQSTGTGFPGETVGLLPNHSRWQPIVQANFSFGYGLTLNALQLAQAYSVIADSGVKKPTSLLRLDKKPEKQEVIDAYVAQTMASMLKEVVKPEGTARRANLEQYTVAGKTGTIHKVGQNGYADDRYISVFAGFAPVEDPKVVAIVVVHEPSRGQYYGGEVAAPVFANVVKRALQIMEVPPRISTVKQRQPKKQKVVSPVKKTQEPVT